MKRHFAQLALAVLALSFLAALWLLRGGSERVRGDEGTYLAMAESLALDGDLWFEPADRTRIEDDSRPGRKPLILQRVEPRVAYSKPILYPLLAAPFFRLFGESGLIVLNVVCLGLALALLARYLGRLDPERSAAPTVVAFAGLGLLIPYVPWRTSDTLQAALTLAGLALCLWDRRGPERREADSAGDRRPPVRVLVGGMLLGCVVSLRLTNAAIAVIPIVALWAQGRRRRAVWAAAALVATCALAAGATTGLAGAPSPYTSVRATFTPQTGYPSAENLAGPQSPFDRDRASYDRSKRLVEAPLASAYGMAYFLAGRHTGILLYFPLAAFLVGAALRRPDRTGWVVLLAVAGLSLFYLVFLPYNYFGGATCVGNRYFLVSYAALPFALRRPLGRAPLAAAWAVGAVVAASALLSVLATRDRDASTQNHAYAGIFRLLPYESTAASIDGGRDVFWRKELGRFVDPYAGVARWKFRLSSEDPPAQLQVANRRPRDHIRLLVLSSAPRLDLIYRDWGRRVRLPLEQPMGERGLVEIEPSRPLRVHPLWFRNVWDHGLPYYIRDFTLAVRTPSGEPAQAEVRYLGTEPWPEEVFSREVLEIELPPRAAPGSVGRIMVSVRNTSPVPWSGGGVFPVSLSYRLVPESGTGAPMEGPRVSLAGHVAPGKAASRSLAVSWPERPGRYRLTVDLMIEGVAWFGSRVGRPLAEGVIVVEEASSPAP